MILAIDPGATESAFVYLDGGRPHRFGKVSNAVMLDMVAASPPLVIEWIASYGMAVGFEVFETCRWVGRFEQNHRGPADRLYRTDVKLHLCGTVKARDANVRQALIDRYGGEAAVRAKKCGRCKGTGKRTKKEIPCDCAGGWTIPPGPLYGLSGDMWAALAVAVTYADGVRSAIKGTPTERT